MPSRPHRASKCSQMEPWATNLMHFSVHLVRFEPSIAQNWLRTLFCSKNKMFYEGDFQKLGFRSRAERIGPEKDTKEASKMTAVGDTLAQLPSKPRAPGTAPKTLLRLYSRKSLFGWVASAMPSKSLVGRLHCFGLCFVRLDWRRKAPMRI